MIENKKINLILPCYNEEEGIQKIFKKDLSFIDEVIVVDNNCSDNTADIAVSYNWKVIKEAKKGYGAAYKAGFKSATGDIIIAMDADDTYPIESAKYFIEKILSDNIDFICGNRLYKGKPKNMQALNYIGNIVLSFFFRLFFIRSLRDSQSGMWVFKRKILDKLELTSSGMPFSQEIKIEAARKGFKITEFPIEYNKRLGDVKLNPWKDGFNNLIFLFKKKIFK
ncbi:MAG: glycosyltransferase family 2 protein [Patescibacteria group bacterium]|jgi:hypothetical protein